VRRVITMWFGGEAVDFIERADSVLNNLESVYA